MKKLFALGLLGILGAWAWSRRRAGVTFAVRLGNWPVGATTWDAYWWNGFIFIPNSRGLTRPVTESAFWQDVAFAPSSVVMATVTVAGVPPPPESRQAPLPNPVNLATYGFDWQTMTLRLL